jgi:hypothetical protein
VSGLITAIDPATDARWERFVASHPDAQVWHTADWLEVIRRTYRYRPMHLAHLRDGELTAILPLFLVESPLTGRRLVSVPFSGPAGPLGWSGEAVNRLVEGAIKLSRSLHCTYLNLQCRDDLQMLTRPDLTATRPFVCSVLSLGGVAGSSPGKPSRSSRKMIARGRRRGVQVRISAAQDELRLFYKLYIATSRRHGMPPQPYRHFELMWESFAPRGAFQMVVAHLDERPIYAMICLTHRDVISAVYAGTDYRYLDWNPVRLGDWTMAEWGRDRGFRTLDLLQSHLNNTGLRWYKQSLGAREIPITHYYHPTIGSTSGLRELLVGGRSRPVQVVKALVRRLPEPALVALGRLVFPHVG